MRLRFLLIGYSVFLSTAVSALTISGEVADDSKIVQCSGQLIDIYWWNVSLSFDIKCIEKEASNWEPDAYNLTAIEEDRHYKHHHHHGGHSRHHHHHHGHFHPHHHHHHHHGHFHPHHHVHVGVGYFPLWTHVFYAHPYYWGMCNI
uniref:Histidine-rich glycoprotein n=1 Tax=Ascaris lumbricoides TaxID=6252 RepID=A0A0M3HZ55_ASCLU